MATVTLTLYKKCELELNKNFIVDDIEAYLATLTNTKTVSNFQYQRFELKKTIKLNLSQDFQTNSVDNSVNNKYNYLKMTTPIGTNGSATYYYFITGYRQIAESTIQLDLEMDTLNTFAYSGVARNNSYTLSPKTVVKREHKDRFTSDVYYTDSVLSQISIPVSPYISYPEDPVILKKYAPDIRRIIDNRTWETTQTYGIGLGVGHSESRYTFKVYNSVSTGYSLAGQYTCHNSIAVTPYDDSVDFTITLAADDSTEVVEVFPNQKVVIEFTKISSNSTAKQHIVDAFIFCYMRGNAQFYRRRIVDQFNEGLATTLFKQEEKTLLDGDGEKHWMLAYRNDETTSTTVNTLLYPEDPLTITTQSATTVAVYPEQIPNKVNAEEWVKFLNGGDYEAGNYIEVNGTQYEVVSASTPLTGNKVHGVLLRKQNSNDTVFKNVYTLELPGNANPIYTNVATNVSSVDVHGWGYAKLYWSYYTNKPDSGGYWQEYWIGSKSSVTSGNVDSWKDVKLYDTKLIKAFIFPYCPSQYLHGRMNITALPAGYKYATTEKAIQLISANDNDFSYELELDGENPQAVLLPDRDNLSFEKEASRDIIYESKLYHSDYYQPKFVYDSFSYTFNLEDVDIDSWIDTFGDPKYFSTTYTVSTNLISKFAFQFSQYATSRTNQDYEGVLCIERNNEKALYNSDYLTYIKNGGYNYDTKKANSQNAVNGITTALSIVGAVASFATSGQTGAVGVAAGIGLATSAAASLTRGIYTAQEQDKSIAQKMLQAQNQGITVQGNEDLDILTAVTGNKAKLVVYKLSDRMNNAMWDLFHYCGYATYEQKIPEHTNRLYFNYVQADIDYDSYTFNEEIAQNIKDKWAQGITYIHKVRNSDDTAFIWDMGQIYENFEVSLLPLE